MPVKSLRFGQGLSVLMRNKGAQAASMTIAPGDSES